MDKEVVVNEGENDYLSWGEILEENDKYITYTEWGVGKDINIDGVNLTKEALKVNLIDDIYSDPFKNSIQLAKEIIKNAPLAVRAAKSSLSSGFNLYFNSFQKVSQCVILP